MKASISWLSDFTHISSTPKDLASALTLSGSKVETIEIPGEEITNVITGRIESIVKHENSDHLYICQVDVGHRDLVQIVTGAPNLELHAVVPVALPGATLAGGLEIKAGELRGVLSNGMMCSIQELGYTVEDYPDAAEDGLYNLPDDTPLGEDIHKILGLDEVVLDFEITNNRPDCYSIEGLGREAAVTLGKPFRPVMPDVLAKSAGKTTEIISIHNDAADLCLAYCGVVVRNVKIEPSPAWMQKRLRSCGVRPINNIVDITNYVMLELGQPMHAFDLSDLAGAEIYVRRAAAGEMLTTLDEKEHKLDESMLVIADRDRAIGLAGIMGGLNSEIRESTRDIVFESATFHPGSVRRTSQRLGIRSESSSRFEKGLDWNNAVRGLARACQLVEQLGCGEVTQDPILLYGDTRKPAVISWSPERINRFLGTAISADYMLDLLGKLGCRHVDTGGKDIWQLEAPSFRPDLEGEADLAEEVARFYGYNRIEPTLLEGKSASPGGRSRSQRLTEAMKDVMLACGYFEAVTYSFESPRHADQLGLPEASPLRRQVVIRNAGEDLSVMRSSMLPSMLNAAASNYRRGIQDGRLFEIGTTFEARDTAAGELPIERKILSAIRFAGEEDKKSGQCFYELKGALNEVMARLGISEWMLQPWSDGKPFHPHRAASVRAGDREAGYIGYLHPQVCRLYEITEQTAVLLLDTAVLLNLASEARSQKPLPKYPAISRDLALLAAKAIPAGRIEDVIRRSAGSILESVEVFDVYTGKQITEGLKSIAFGLTFRHPERTLKDEEVQTAMDRVREALSTELDVKQR